MAVQPALIHTMVRGMLLQPWWPLYGGKIVKLTGSRPRSTRGRKEVGMIGQASWISSVINLVNTSMRRQKTYGGPQLTLAQSLVPVSSPCP